LSRSGRRAKTSTSVSASSISPRLSSPRSPPSSLTGSRRRGSAFGRGKIARYAVLRSDVVHHNLIEGRLLAAVELQRLVHIAILLLVAAVVGKHPDREAVMLRVGLAQLHADRAHWLAMSLVQREFVIVAVALMLQRHQFVVIAGNQRVRAGQ